MNRIVAIALNTFREAIRNKILYSLLFFAIALIVSALALGQVSLHEEARVTRDLGLGGIALFGVLIAIFVGVNLVYKELDKKTVFSLIPKPIHRYHFIIGKFIGMVMTLAVQVAIMSVVLYLVLLVQESPMQGPLLRAIALLFIEVVVITAIAVFFSTFTSPFLSGLFTLGIFVVGRSAPELRELIAKLPRPVLRQALALVTGVVPDLHIFYVSGSMLHGQPVSVHAQFVDWGYVATAAAYGGLYASSALVLAVILFHRRDFV